LDYLKIKRGDIILEQAERLISILQDPGDVSTSGEKASLRAELYRKLIAPVLPFLDGIDNLYIAPHDQLCNLPFEILYADGHGLLQDEYKICRLVCGRDLLFYDNCETTGGSSFILGNPDYEAERGERISSKTRSVQKSLNPVSALPFSGVEASRIGRRYHTRIYTGNAATKYALQEALPCSTIHLATHGVFDDQMETDSLYASHLVFAGYNKWVSNGTESRFCGNGVLTADEISRMDLKKTELVVLSACQSGLGDTSYGSVRGLISAFSAAGARWIISHMWEADDFSVPILMDAFYDAYQNKGRDVPDALQYAKNYLRTVTIGTLRREGWLDLPDDIRFSEDIRLAIADMRGCPNDTKPFEDEFYWGGFTVHKSR
jgi:CHAT domain-containing protein